MLIAFITFFCLILLHAAVLAEKLCSLDNGMTDELRKIFLDKHNEYRSLVASGQAPNPRYGGSTPKAARMLKARYDCEVEEDMTNWAQAQCTYEPFRSSKGYGRNTWGMGVPYYNKTAAAESSVSDWFFELRRFGVPQNNLYTSDIDNTAYHYSQMVWQDSYKIGCVVAWCPGMTWVACGYSPAGNNIGSLIYELGQPCNKNEDCKCTDCTCSEGEALCIPPEESKPATTSSTTAKTTTTTTKPTTTTTTTTTPTTTFDRAAWEESVKKPVAHCTLDNGMTDEARQVFLDKHNEYRQTVARGEAKNKTGLAPPAARMLQMRYDCDLEAHVMEHVAKCKGGHSTFDVLKGRGQNIWAITVPNLDKAEAAKRSVDDWYIELTKYGITADNKISIDNAAKTGHYSQVVWQKSNRLGCAAVSCPEQRRLYVGCEYWPGGNTLRHLIYDIGEPCKRDEDCKCSSCRCSTQLSMCINPN